MFPRLIWPILVWENKVLSLKQALIKPLTDKVCVNVMAVKLSELKLSLRGTNENNICPAVIFWWCTTALGLSRWATICELLQKRRPLTQSSLQVRVMAADNGLCVACVQIIGNLKQSPRFLWQWWFELRSTEDFNLTSWEQTDCLLCDLWP